MAISAEVTDISIDIPQNELEKLLGSELAKDESYWPFVVHVDSEHASYVEFGTTGKGEGKMVRGKRSKGAFSSSSEFSDNIKTWLRNRGALMGNGGVFAREGPSEDQVAFAVMKKLIEQGMPPQPFIRPAVHTVEQELEDGIFEDATMDDVAAELESLMIWNLDSNHTIYPGGTIADTIHIERYNPSSEEIEGGAMVNGEPISENIWKSDYADWKGNEDRAKERRANIRSLRF